MFFLLLLLPLAFSLVFSFLAFGHFSRFFSSSNLSFSLYNLRWSEFRLPPLHFLGLQNATFAILARLVSGPFLGMGPEFLRKHYKNRGFRVFWHPSKHEILGPKSKVKMLVKVTLKCWPSYVIVWRGSLKMLGSARKMRFLKKNRPQTWPAFNPTAYIYIYI